MRFAKVLVLVVVSGATALAQIHDLSRIPTISPVPNDFVGNWDWTTPRQSCGTSRDSYGQPVTFDGKDDGRVVCQWPIDRLEKVLNGRGRAWRTFTLNGADDAISPRWTCVAAKPQRRREPSLSSKTTGLLEAVAVRLKPWRSG